MQVLEWIERLYKRDGLEAIQEHTGRCTSMLTLCRDAKARGERVLATTYALSADRIAKELKLALGQLEDRINRQKA